MCGTPTRSKTRSGRCSCWPTARSSARRFSPRPSAGPAGSNLAGIASATCRRPEMAEADLDELAALYRDLHAHPELAFAEHRTAAIIADRLGGLGYQVTAGVGGTGVVAVLDNGPGPTVLLRADMDALPVLEQTGLEYASTVRAKEASGADVPVMHACGHDM